MTGYDFAMYVVCLIGALTSAVLLGYQVGLKDGNKKRVNKVERK